MENLHGYAEALAALNAHLTPRAKDLRRLEQFVEGTQYDGLDDFFSDRKPLWERAPCITYPIVKMAIDSNRDLLLGEGRWPQVTVHGAAGEAADLFEACVADAIEKARLKPASNEAFVAGQGCGSAVAIFGVLNGRYTIKSVYARWCVPTFDPEGSVEQLEIQYPYLEVITDGDLKKVVCRLYRRVLDQHFDTTFHVKTVTEADAKRPSPWTPALEIIHGLGFCPVVYYAHQRQCSVVNDYDGCALHEHQLDEIRAHDFAVSQRHRAALFAGDPQIVEIGVKKGYDPVGGRAGRTARMPALHDSIPAEGGSGYYDFAGASYGSSSPARKKGPGVIWTYDTQDASKVKVDLLTLPGDALTAIDNHAKDLKSKLAEALGVVLMDLGSMPDESRLSGKALETFLRPQLARVDSYRHDFANGFLIPAIGMLLRIAIVKGLKIANLETVTAAAAADPSWSWHSPPLNVNWGDYFKPSAEDDELLIRGTMAAVGGQPILTLRAAVERLRGVLGVKDVDAYLKELEAQNAEIQAQQTKQVQAEAQAKAAARPQPKPTTKAA